MAPCDCLRDQGKGAFKNLNNAPQRFLIEVPHYLMDHLSNLAVFKPHLIMKVANSCDTITTN